MILKKIKSICSLVLGSMLVLTACDKGFEQPGSYSSFAVIHASPVSSTSPTDTIHVFLDTAKYSSTGTTYLNNTGYLPVASGSRPVNLRRKGVYTSDLYASTFTNDFESGKAYSFFVYDTTTSPTGTAKVLQLKDDLTLPAPNMAHIRVLHLAPRGPAVDIVLVRTTTPANQDSITIANKTYVGAEPNATTLSPFTPVTRGTYIVKIKAAGTQTVLISTTVALTPAADLNIGRIVTIFVTGTAKGRPLTIGTFRHY